LCCDLLLLGVQDVVHDAEGTAPVVALEQMVAREIDVVQFTSVPSVPSEHQGKLLGIIGKSFSVPQRKEEPS
jgi:hypothetical protein